VQKYLAACSLIALLCTIACGGGGSSSSSSNNCASTAVGLSQQLRNPVSAFPVDNNGTIMQLPPVPNGGVSGISSTQGGALVFGIGTASNNAVAGTQLTLDPNPGTATNPNYDYAGFMTQYGGVTYEGSFIDSGSNAIYYLDQPTTHILDCSGSLDSWYCPNNAAPPFETLGQTATNESTYGQEGSILVSFNVSSANLLFSSSNDNGNNTAFSDLAGPNTPGNPNSNVQAADAYFDWGLSFFYNRNIYTAINGVNGQSAYWSVASYSPAGTANNVAPLYVDYGPVPTVNFQVNIPFVTVTICAPGSTNCQTIDHVAVDTGSVGLRIPYSVLNSTLAAALTNVNGSTPLAECIQFLDGSFFWGSVKFADVKMGGANNTYEVASSIPIHVMGDPAVEELLPSSCSTVTNSSGSQVSGTEEDTVNALGANGLLGIGNYQYDCDALSIGNICASVAVPSTYYACTP